MLDFKALNDQVGGWLTESESKFLYQTACNIQKKNVIVEIGSWKGKSTICLGQGTKDGKKAFVFAVDPHTGSIEHRKMFGKLDTFQIFTQNIHKTKVDKFIIPIRKTSEKAIRNINYPVEFIFIDGSHEYKYVKLDYKLWFPKVINGGILAFHDSWHYFGPNMVTAIPLLFSSRIRNPGLVDTITYFEKVERNSFLDRCHNLSFLIFRSFFGFLGFYRIKYFGCKII
jgi:MMP 1-O-methyltransferase